MRLDIRRIGAIKKGDEVIGNETRVKVVKNKVAPPFKQAEFDILYGEGISREGEIIDLGVQQGIIDKSGAWYSYNDDRIGQGKENVREFLKENPEIADEIDQALRAKLLPQSAGRAGELPAKGLNPEVEPETVEIPAVPTGYAGPHLQGLLAKKSWRPSATPRTRRLPRTRSRTARTGRANEDGRGRSDRRASPPSDGRWPVRALRASTWRSESGVCAARSSGAGRRDAAALMRSTPRAMPRRIAAKDRPCRATALRRSADAWSSADAQPMRAKGFGAAKHRPRPKQKGGAARRGRTSVDDLERRDATNWDARMARAERVKEEFGEPIPAGLRSARKQAVFYKIGVFLPSQSCDY